MDNFYADLARVMIRPGIFLLFGVAFLWVWALERKRSWILNVAAACLTLGVAMIFHFLAWPGGAAPASIVSGFLYTIAVLAACEGLLLRVNKSFSPRFHFAVLALLTGLLWYFMYVEPSLWTRIYIQNFGYGALLLLTTFRLTGLQHGSLTDRVLFWVMLGFSVQFFVRTSLTLGFSAPEKGMAFVASPFWNILQLSLTVFGAGLAFVILLAAVSDMMEALRHERDNDVLTGTLNRRGLEDQVHRLFRNAVPGSVSIIVCDIDHFKSINDTFGHDAGDVVLQAFGSLLKQEVRPQDLVARTGGEEFSVVLRAAGEKDALEIADRIRLGFETMKFNFEPGTRLVTASFGVAERCPGESFSSTSKRADERLYEAKRAGRNRVVGKLRRQVA